MFCYKVDLANEFNGEEFYGYIVTFDDNGLEAAKKLYPQPKYWVFGVEDISDTEIGDKFITNLIIDYAVSGVQKRIRHMWELR